MWRSTPQASDVSGGAGTGAAMSVAPEPASVPLPVGAATSGAVQARRRRRFHGAAVGITPYLYIAPALAIYACFALLPLIHTFYLSFFRWDGITPGTFNGIGNYVTIASDPDLRSIFWHPLVLIVFYSLIPIALGIIIASTMTRIHIRGLTFFRAVLFLPQVIATVSVALAWQNIYALDGPLNALLSAVGLGAITRAWLGDWNFALPALGLIGTWFTFGFCMLLFLAGAQKIPRDLFETARVDGARAWQEVRHVLVPGLRKEIVFALVLTVINALRTFDINYILTKGGPGLQTDVPSYEVYRQAFVLGNVGQGAAFGVVLTVLLLVIVIPLTRLEGKD
jgi:raffinose/stachyose/melibiose transport system permease protein